MGYITGLRIGASIWKKGCSLLWFECNEGDGVGSQGEIVRESAVYGGEIKRLRLTV